MLSLEQVRLLDAKVAKAVDTVRQLTEENASLRKKLDTNQKRVDELEALVTSFREDQGRIEDGILSALDRLNQFEIAIEKNLAARKSKAQPPAACQSESQAPEDNSDDDPVVSVATDPEPENGELDIF